MQVKRKILTHESSQIIYSIQNDICTIQKLCVDRNFRGHHYGKALLMRCVQDASNHKCRVLMVQDGSLLCNQDEKNIYFGIGMTITERKPVVYRSGSVVTALERLKQQKLPEVQLSYDRMTVGMNEHMAVKSDDKGSTWVQIDQFMSPL